MHSYLPSECPQLSVREAASCLRRRRLRRVYFVGDSVSYQLAFTMVCDLGLSVDAGRRVDGNGFTLKLVSLVCGVELAFMWPKPRAQRAQDLARALNSSFSGGHLLEPALWMVNAGLWHTVTTPPCEANCTEPRPTNAESNDAAYAVHLAALLEVLVEQARGHVIWRDTTAVHPGRMYNDAPAAVRQKFASMSNVNIRRLNADAAHVVARYPRIQSLNLYFAATRERAGGTAPGDIRHWRADVLHLLLQITFLAWCEYL